MKSKILKKIMQKEIFLIMAMMIVLSPLQFIHAATDAELATCTVYNCTCTSDTGSAKDTIYEDETSCNNACFASHATSYTLTCTTADATATPIKIAQGNSDKEMIDIEISSPETPEAEVKSYTVPVLNVPIPGFDGFTRPTTSGTDVSVGFIGQYIGAIYNWILGAAALVAVVMMMVGGLQYVMSRGKEKYITKAKERITNAITGIILLLLVYNLAFFIDPRTLDLKALQIQNVAGIEIAQQTEGAEGEGTAGGSIGAEGTAYQSLTTEYLAIVQEAKANDSCPITGDKNYWTSPTGKLPNQGNHHWYDREANGNYAKIHALDFAAPWDSVFVAPIDGTAKYTQGTKEPNGGGCGNMIVLTGSGYTLTICHSKDFMTGDTTIDSQIASTKTRQVKRGEPLGHVGAVTCTDSTANKNANPYVHTSLSGNCLPEVQSGHTTGGHVHIQGTNILACFP